MHNPNLLYGGSPAIKQHAWSKKIKTCNSGPCKAVLCTVMCCTYINLGLVYLILWTIARNKLKLKLWISIWRRNSPRYLKNCASVSLWGVSVKLVSLKKSFVRFSVWVHIINLHAEEELQRNKKIFRKQRCLLLAPTYARKHWWVRGGRPNNAELSN